MSKPALFPALPTDSANLVEDVIACRLDLAEVTGIEPDDRLVNMTYSDQSIVLFVVRSHPLASSPAISAERLHDQPMVARHSTSMTRQIFQRRLDRRGIRPRIVMELDSWEAMKEAVAAGIGFGIALEDEYVQDPRLIGVRVTDLDLSARQYVVCLPEFEQLRPIKAFLNVVQEAKSNRRARGSRVVLERRPNPSSMDTRSLSRLAAG